MPVTSPWNIPLVGDTDPIAPIQNLFNGQANALNAALNSVTTDTGWLSLPLNSGFIARPSNPAPQYRRIGKLVRLRGQVQPTSGNFTSSNPIVGVIPGALGPSVYSVFAGGGGGVTMRLTIGTGGQVQCAPMDAAASSAYADLAAISFWVD